MPVTLCYLIITTLAKGLSSPLTEASATLLTSMKIVSAHASGELGSRYLIMIKF